MKRRYRGLPTTTILVTVVVSVVAIILCCCILLFLNRYRGAMVQSARTSTAQAVSQVSNTVGSYLQGMEQAMDRVEQAMAEAPDDRDRLLSAFLLFRPDVVAITSYSETGELTDCWALEREPRDDILQNLSFDPVRAMASDSAYLTAPHVESIFESYYPWVVTMTAPLETGRDAAWVSLDLSFSSISSYINDVGIGQRGYCFLMDGDGTIVYHPQQRLLYAGLKSEDTSGLAALADGTYADDTVIYSLSSVQGGAWRVVGVSYVDELVNQNMRAMLRLSVAMAAVILAAALLTSWLLSRLLGRPLRGLAAAMERFERDADRFAYRPVGGTREVRELSNSFGHMVVRIQRLMSTVREEEVNLRKTELKALQAQINPTSSITRWTPSPGCVSRAAAPRRSAWCTLWPGCSASASARATSLSPLPRRSSTPRATSRSRSTATKTALPMSSGWSRTAWTTTATRSPSSPFWRTPSTTGWS